MKKNYPLILLYALITFATLNIVSLATILFYSLEFGRGLEYGTSKYIPLFVLVIFAVLGTVTSIFNWKFHKKSTSILHNILVPVSFLNTLLLLKKVGSAALWCVGFAVATPLIIILFKRFTEKLLKMSFVEMLFPLFKETSQGTLSKGTSSTSKLWSGIISSFIVLFITSTVALWSFGILESYYYAYEKNDIYFSETYISAEDMQEFSKIENKVWRNLSLREKANILQRIADIEAIRLGVPLPPRVDTVELYDSFYNVNFNVETNTIELDINILNDSNGYRAIKAVAHGMFYSYENAKNELITYLDRPENALAFSCLVDLRDNRLNNEFSFETNAFKYSNLVQSEYKRKLKLYKFDSSKTHY